MRELTIREEMLTRAKAKLASGRLSEVDRSYYQHVIDDFGSGRTQEAATPAAPAPAVGNRALDHLFGVK
jgi:hypothetical protein